MGKDGCGASAAGVHRVPGGQPAFPWKPTTPRERARADQSADQKAHQRS